MANKRAIELSLNFIVVLIISLIIFGFGVKFISELSSHATELQDLTISELDERIGNLICDSSERVCIGIDRKTIKRANFGIFGVKIINIFDSQDFDITIKPSSPAGYTKDKKEIQGVSLILNPQQRSVFIGRNDEASIGIGVQVPADAVSGTYILNVEIKTQDAKPYSAIQKLYVDVP